MFYRPAELWRPALLAMILSLGCEGAIDDGDESPSAPSPAKTAGTMVVPELPGGPKPPGVSVSPPDQAQRPATFACTQGTSAAHQPLRRLTRLQLVHAISDAMDQLLGGSAADVKKAIAPQLERIPTDRYTSTIDRGRDGFTNADQDLTQVHADATLAVAIALGTTLTDSESRRRTLFGACAVDMNASNDVSCVDDFVRKWGPRLLRGPITEDDVAFYRKGLRGTVASPDALADVVALLFASPRFGFHVEIATPIANSPPAELASRLAFLLWDAPPDAELWQTADSGDLATEKGYRAQVQRLLRSPRATATVERFYREWFSLYAAPNLTASLGQADYKAVVGTDKPTSAATGGMVEDVLGLVRDVFNTDRPMIDFLTERRSYTKDPYVAAVYAVNLVAGESPLPPSKARVGFITRPAFVASGDYSTHPIITQRIQAESQTSPPGCAGCHLRLNPLGFATENFDSLGRERTHERVFDQNGKLKGEVPVDTRIVPHVDDDDTVMVDGAEGVMKSLVRSRKVEACFSAQLVRFAFGKKEEDRTADGCMLTKIEAVARRGGSIRDLLQTLVESPDFTRRRVN